MEQVAEDEAVLGGDGKRGDGRPTLPEHLAALKRKEVRLSRAQREAKHVQVRAGCNAGRLMGA